MHNQEAQLSQCLRRLSFCDQVIVVADRCTDRSAEIARRQGATVISGIFPLESQRKAAGLEAATGDWVLELSPDEQVSSALAWEIRATLRMRPVGDWFDIPLHNYVGEALVCGGWTGVLSDMRSPRLYRPGAKRWQARRTDVSSPQGARAGALKGALRRDLASDTSELVQRLNAYAALSAEDLAEAGRLGFLPAALLKGVGGFLTAYGARRGWREGRLGFLVAMISGLHPVLAHLKARDLIDARERAAAVQQDDRRPEVVGLGAR